MADVLVVDDDPAMRLLLDLLLRADGHRVRQAATVEQALLASAEQRPDLLLLDINLAGQRGDALIPLLDRGLGRPRRVCLVSSQPAPELAAVAAEHDVRWLSKPVDPAALQRLLVEVDADGVEPSNGGGPRPRR